MPMNDLDAFLDRGFAAVLPSDVQELATVARDRCYSTGDVRFCIASDCLEIVASCWDEGGIRESVADDLEAVVMGELALAIRERDADAGRVMALQARTSLLEVLRSAGDLVYGE